MVVSQRVESLRSIIADVLQEIPQVRLVYLFGSQAQGTYGPLSDYDFAVLTDPPFVGEQTRARLLSVLAGALGIENVDAVLLNQVPVELAYCVIATGTILYERDVSVRIEYEARVMGMYGDYLPVLRTLMHDVLKEDEYEARVQRYREAIGRTERTLSAIRASQEKSQVRV